MVVEIVAVVAGLVALTAMVRAGARRIGVPDPIALLVVGAAVSWVPGIPPLRIDPDLVLVVLLPLLLYGAAFAASLPAFRRHIRPILLLSVGLTIVSALAVGVVASTVVPGLGFAAACALGAAVAPPDAVAATAVARGIRLPRRVEALLEGESLFNDAAALTVLTVAVAAATGEGLTFAQATGQFLLSALGGLVIGGLVAAVMAWVRRRVRNPYTDVVVFLVAPFAAYLPADVVGASGLVAVVCTGLYLGHRATTIMEPGARVVTGSVRTAMSWLLEGIVFLLVGLKLRDVIAGLASTPLAVVITSSVAVVITLVVVRVVWLALTEQAIPAALGRRSATWGESTLTAWAGMRGAVSLAAVLTLPLVLPDGQAFPQRDLIVFLTFVVILATLLGQGLTLPLLARRLAGGGSEVSTEARQEAHARREAADAALACLENMEQDDRGGEEVVEQLRRRVQNRRHDADEQLAALESRSHTDAAESADSDPQAFLEPRTATGNGQQELPRDTYRRYGQAMITAERTRLLSLRDEGELTEATFDRIQRELDLEQAALLVR